MSFADLARRLEQSFRLSSKLLRRLLTGLQERRAAWVSARPSTIAPALELEAIAAEMQGEDARRAELLVQLAGLLPPVAGVAPRSLHVDVSAVAARLPRAQARELRLAADDATAVARAVRRELALGTRLLGFAQRAHDGLLADAAAAARQKAVPGYDRNARTNVGVAGVTAAGSLVDGKV